MDEDEVMPLRQSDNESVATSTGAHRPSIQFRRSSSGLKRSPTEPPLRRTRSRQFSRTSTDSILLPRISEDPLSDPDEPTQQWHSLSLAFVALPAFAGLFFENGSAIMTDILMLGLGCLFLYWSVKWPWQWYYSAQELKLAEVDPDAEYAIVEESGEEDGLEQGEGGFDSLKSAEDKAPSRYPGHVTTRRAEARKSLESLELMALLSCFLSPMVVAYMLHNIRPYLSRPSGGVVSNSNLTLFVLAAEVRPVLHFFRLVEERTLHLQRIVQSLPASEENQRMDQIETLAKRLEDLEVQRARPLAGAGEKDRGSASEPNLERNVRQSLQPQLDALNRAVRRYEKRAMTQAIVTEARLQDLEARLKDALSLAAAASRSHQKGGLVDYIISWISMLAMAPLDAVRTLVLWPVQLAIEIYRFLLGPRRKKRRTTKSSDFRDFKGKGSLEQR